jgi:murein DD-endopeptidase
MMNATWTRTSSKERRERRHRRLRLIGLLVLVVGIASCLYKARTGEEAAVQSVADVGTETVIDRPVQAETAINTVVSQAAPDNIITREIQSGDTLSAIFDSVSIDQATLYQILAADESLLALDVLHPENRLTFTLDDATRALTKMELYIHPGKQVVYQRIDADTFEYEEVEIPGVWRRKLVSGEISGSFYQSAMDAGLSEQDAGNISDLFKSRLNFARDIRLGDQFQVVCKEQYIDGQYTGQSHISGVRIFNRNQVYTAFLFEDGNYYDQDGGSLASAFLRYPFLGNYRISSAFNPKRKNPVTGRISKHTGTDFSMSTGTSVLATGDGIVSRVKNHPYAGTYIEIQHSGQYVTRYLHLSRALVKKGQAVKRGEVIAKSGNTGRSTGPHLHFELRINGRPVNPITADIPMADAIPESSRQAFNAQCTALISFMEKPRAQIAAQIAATDAWSDPAP